MCVVWTNHHASNSMKHSTILSTTQPVVLYTCWTNCRQVSHMQTHTHTHTLLLSTYIALPLTWVLTNTTIFHIYFGPKSCTKFHAIKIAGTTSSPYNCPTEIELRLPTELQQSLVATLLPHWQKYNPWARTEASMPTELHCSSFWWLF